MSKDTSKTVLHADDSAAVRRWVAEQLAELDVKVVSVSDGAAALEMLQRTHADASIFARAGLVLAQSQRGSPRAASGSDRLAGETDSAGEPA
jgi:CheY-like chemotaxis protein